LYRLPHTLAKARGLSIYSEDTLKNTGILFPPGQKFEQVNGYTYANEQEKGEISMKVEACPEQCDVDDFAVADLFSRACSHWLNTCQNSARRDVGDWCYINYKRLYIGGTTTGYSCFSPGYVYQVSDENDKDNFPAFTISFNCRRSDELSAQAQHQR
jgi:hypothetical protein